jgi:hypothetical protein
MMMVIHVGGGEKLVVKDAPGPQPSTAVNIEPEPQDLDCNKQNPSKRTVPSEESDERNKRRTKK